MSDLLKVNVISMSRTGHRAIMQWLRERIGSTIYNTESKPFAQSVAKPGLPVLVLRDYRNWMASLVYHMLPLHVPQHRGRLEQYIDMWVSHTEAAFSVPTILYPDWVRAGYGKNITIRGNPTDFHDDDTLHRYEQMSHDDEFRRVVEGREDALRVNERVFGGPTAEGRVGVFGADLTGPALGVRNGSR